MVTYTTAIIIFTAIIALTIWDLVWKGMGMWKAGRNNSLVWFVILFLINTAGILPIIYIFFIQKKKQKHHSKQSKK